MMHLPLSPNFRGSIQWCSGVKCCPGPTTKVSPFSPFKFAYNIKHERRSCFVLSKNTRNIKTSWTSFRTLTGWNYFCFLFSIMDFAFSACSPYFSSFALPIFSAIFTFASADQAYFVKFSSLLAFSLRYAAPLDFNKKHKKCVIAGHN